MKSKCMKLSDGMKALLLSAALLGGSLGTVSAGLVGKWTFTNGSLADETGNFPNDLILTNGCHVLDHALVVAPNQYAYTMGYNGPTVTNKTLVAWAYMDSLTTYGGSLISFLKGGTWEPVFDGIVYGERTRKQWMAGSDGWSRSPVDNGGALETNGPNSLIQMAIVYESTNITIYRNGALYASYSTNTTPQIYPPATNTWACFGLRLFHRHQPYGWIYARITEARIYDEALTQAQIAALTPEPDPYVPVSTNALVGKWNFTGGSLKDEMGNFSDLTLYGGCYVTNHALKVYSNKYAVSWQYNGPVITTKTLVAWAYMDSLTVKDGSLLSIFTNGTYDPVFDGIVYGEFSEYPKRWIAGSDYHKRTQYPPDGTDETADPDTLIQMAIVYDAANNIRIYRNGELYSSYNKGSLQTYSAGVSNGVCFGIRLYFKHIPQGWVSARITEARIYREALSRLQIQGLKPDLDGRRGTLILVR